MLGAEQLEIQIRMGSAYTAVIRGEIGFQGGMGEPERQGNQILYSAGMLGGILQLAPFLNQYLQKSHY